MALAYRPSRDTHKGDTEAAIQYSCAKNHDFNQPPIHAVRETRQCGSASLKGPLQWVIPVKQVCPDCQTRHKILEPERTTSGMLSTLKDMDLQNRENEEFIEGGRLLQVIPKGSRDVLEGIHYDPKLNFPS